MDYNELYHHGIKGQKWGVRRTQAQLGHTTPKKTDAQKASEAKKRSDSKNRGTLTTAQLEKKIKRLQMEKQLRELTDFEVNAGRKAVKETLTQIGKKVASTAISGAALYGIAAAVTRSFNIKDFGKAIFNGGAKKK